MKTDILYRYFQCGQSQRKIAEETKLSRNTVKKYIDSYSKQNQTLLQSNDTPSIIEAMQEPPKYDCSSRKPTIITPEIIKIIKECITQNSLKLKIGQRKMMMTGKDIYDHLIEQGHKLSYATVSLYVRKYSAVKKEAFIKQLYEYGEIVEFDWGDIPLTINGKSILFRAAVFTTAKTNVRFAYLYRNEDTQCFIDSHAKFFDKFGIYKTVVYDNMKVAVSKFVGSEKVPTIALKQLSTYYGFNFRFCNIRRGNEKGHVENSVDFIRRKAFSFKNSFANSNEAMLQLSKIIDKINSDKTQEYEKEKQYLLPSKPKYCSSVRTTGIVDKLSCITFKQNKYSVPDYLVGKAVDIKVFIDEIFVYYQDKLVARHIKSFKNHDFILDIMHYRETLSKKPGAVKNSVAFSLMQEKLQKIYFQYFNKTPKEFVALLNVVAVYDVDKVVETITKLNKLGVKISLDSIKLQLMNKPDCTYSFKEDEIEEMCIKQITNHNNLWFKGVLVNENN